jgi:hypothetical protein
MGIIRDRIQARRPVLSTIGAVVRDVVIGSPRPANAPTANPSVLAPYRKLIAVPVGALLVWAGQLLGLELGTLEPEVTALVIGYLVWRFPNAQPAA